MEGAEGGMIQILDDYAESPEREKKAAELLRMVVRQSAIIKDLVKSAKTREDLLDINHHFGHILGKLALPASDLEGLTLKQADKDSSRERFILNGRMVEGPNFMKELLDKTAALKSVKKAELLTIAQYIYMLCSRTIWDGDIYFIAHSLFVQPSQLDLLMQPVLKSDVPRYATYHSTLPPPPASASSASSSPLRAQVSLTLSSTRSIHVEIKEDLDTGKNVIFIRTFSSYDLHRSDDIDAGAFSAGGWVHLDASLTVRVDIEGSANGDGEWHHTRHLKLAFKAPFGGLADLGCGKRNRCAHPHVYLCTSPPQNVRDSEVVLKRVVGVSAWRWLDM
jgi:hypothetical protein